MPNGLEGQRVEVHEANERPGKTQNAGKTRRSIPREVFDGVTLTLAVLAIIFAIIQFGDARNQIKQAQNTLDQLKSVTVTLEPVARSVQTRYVGSFPDNMDEIMNVVKGVPDGGELVIMTDFSGYGLYSRNDLYLEYISELRRARSKRRVNERILVYDRDLANEALKRQFTVDRYNQERRNGFRSFFITHPPAPPDYTGFLGRVGDLLMQPIQEMCNDGIQVRLVPSSRKYLFFLWANSRPQALFAFRNESESYRELSFATVDNNLTNVFQILFEQTWKEVDPKHLDPNILENNRLLKEIPVQCGPVP
jgi:hypothetical protein